MTFWKVTNIFHSPSMTIFLLMNNVSTIYSLSCKASATSSQATKTRNWTPYSCEPGPDVLNDQSEATRTAKWSGASCLKIVRVNSVKLLSKKRYEAMGTRTFTWQFTNKRSNWWPLCRRKYS